ncbi:tyrosine-type recombinase/integrase [Opitutales bacterium]|nr:tyrosine-type recombinase/integrase [Opitutales bacterium]
MPKLLNKKQNTVVIEGVCTIRHIAKNDKWEVDAGLKLGGDKKHRKRFKLKDEALTYGELLKSKLRNQGTRAFKLTTAQQVDAEQALKALRETKFNTLLEAVEFTCRYAGKNLSDMTINELVCEFREMKESERSRDLRGASDATLDEYKYRHGLLADNFGEILVREFTEEKFIPLYKAKNCSPNLLSKTKTLFNYAVKKGVIPENPIKIDPPKKKAIQPRVFSDDEWRNLVLTAIRTQEHTFSKGEPVELLAYVVLGLWCGLRPTAEIERLKWKDIHLDDDKPSVYIQPDWKVKHSRWVDIPECAATLLKTCRKHSGHIVNPKNLRRRLAWLKEEAGVSDTWSADIMRHTFASMHYGFHQDKNGIANQLGHVDQTVLGHYINNGKRIRERANTFFNFTMDKSILR